MAGLRDGAAERRFTLDLASPLPRVLASSDARYLYGLNRLAVSPQVDAYTGAPHDGYAQDAMFARR